MRRSQACPPEARGLPGASLLGVTPQGKRNFCGKGGIPVRPKCCLPPILAEFGQKDYNVPEQEKTSGGGTYFAGYLFKETQEQKDYQESQIQKKI